MRKVLIAVLLMLAAFCRPMPAAAVDRITWWYGEQPPSQNLNLQQRYVQYALGQLAWDFLGRTNDGGYFTNTTISPGGTWTVTVAPSVPNTLMSLYQVQPADVNAWGGQAGMGLPTGPGDTPLGPDANLMYQWGWSNSAITVSGFAAPSSPNSEIDLIECQVQTVDTSATLTNFVDSTGAASSGTVPRDRKQVIACQRVAGSPSLTPSVPATDSGWFAYGYVTIAYTDTSINSGMITTYPEFTGFATSSVSFVDLSTNQTAAGNKTWSGLATFNNAIVLGTPGPAPTPSGVGIWNDQQTNPGMVLDVTAGSAGVQVLVGGATLVAYINASGDASFHSIALATPLAASYGGTNQSSWTANECVHSVSTTTLANAAGDCLVGVTGSTYIAVTGSGTNPTLSITGVPTTACLGWSGTAFTSSTCVTNGGSASLTTLTTSSTATIGGLLTASASESVTGTVTATSRITSNAGQFTANSGTVELCTSTSCSINVSLSTLGTLSIPGSLNLNNSVHSTSTSLVLCGTTGSGSCITVDNAGGIQSGDIQSNSTLLLQNGNLVATSVGHQLILASGSNAVAVNLNNGSSSGFVVDNGGAGVYGRIDNNTSGTVTCSESSSNTCTATASYTTGQVCTASYDEATTVNTSNRYPLEVDQSAGTVSFVGKESATENKVFGFRYLCI